MKNLFEGVVLSDQGSEHISISPLLHIPKEKQELLLEQNKKVAESTKELIKALELSLATILDDCVALSKLDHITEKDMPSLEITIQKAITLSGALKSSHDSTEGSFFKESFNGDDNQ